MNVYILTDMEGVSGIVNEAEVRPGQAAYAEGRLLLAGDVNAASAGAFDAGATRVVVADGHGGGFNFPLENMDSRAEYERPSSGRDLMPALSRGFDAVVAIGMHAMSGTPCAFLEHTQSSENWHRYRIDGTEYGEIAQCAFYAGAFGVPLVFVVGDLAAAEEARALVSNLETVAVKEAYARLRCRSLAPLEAHQRIRQGVAAALERRHEIAPAVLAFPVTLQIEFNRCSSADEYEGKPDYRRIDGFTIEWTAENERQLLPW